MARDRGYGFWPGFFITFEGFLKILEFVSYPIKNSRLAVFA